MLSAVFIFKKEFRLYFWRYRNTDHHDNMVGIMAGEQQKKLSKIKTGVGEFVFRDQKA